MPEDIELVVISIVPPPRPRLPILVLQIVGVVDNTLPDVVAETTGEVDEEEQEIIEVKPELPSE